MVSYLEAGKDMYEQTVKLLQDNEDQKVTKDQYCKVCKRETKHLITYKQLRSADEGETKISKCISCGKNSSKNE